MPQTNLDTRGFFDSLKGLMEDSPQVESFQAGDECAVCRATGAVDSIEYRVRSDQERVWVSFETADRWMSESIEADLMNSGDNLEELIEDELADLGASDIEVSFEHFRSEEMLFTFRSPIPIPAAGLNEIVSSAANLMLAYIACFAQLGDVIEDD